MSQYGAGRVLDARRPKLGNALQPVTRQPAAQGPSVWACAAMMAGSGMLLAVD